ncbi:MAG: PKD domain-containing protein [Planctomycetes bacterium]|nr:PKD domain-containing protein [Planctomycetota bacterium]
MPRSRLPSLAAVCVVAVLSALAVAFTRDAGAQDMMGAAAQPIVHDPAYFRDRVLPVLAQHCIACHEAGDPDNKSKNRIVAPGADGKFDAAAVQKNYETFRALMDAKVPERSTVLLKLIPVSRGGVDHDGGKADDTEFPSDLTDPKSPLVAWAFGATATDAPPIAAWSPVPRQVTVGDEVRLDATLAYDPEGKPVTVRWEVHDAPQGARAKPDDPLAKTTRIVPDREGPWVVRLRVDDGKLRGWPALLRFAAVRKAVATDPAAPTPAVPAAQVDVVTRRATRLLFLDLWGRTPTDEELAKYAALPWSARVDALLGTEETWRNWLEEECFYFLLIDQFRPVSDRVAGIPAAMCEGRMGFREAHQTIALSSEFNARNPGNDTFCTVVFEQFLGIEVQKNVKLLETAKLAYDGKQQRIFDVQVKNQSDVVQATLDQKAYTDVFLRRMEQRFLRGALPKAEHEGTVAVLQSQPREFRNILREWLLSDRYVGADRPPRRKSDFQFIRSLFVDLLGRAPAYEEFRNMRNALQALADPTPLRGVLAKVLLDSSASIAPPVGAAMDERYAGDRWRPAVTDLFRRLLGREPSTVEMDLFVTALQEPGATWRTAAMGLLSSPQYQYY